MGKKKTDKQQHEDWKKFLENIRRATPIDLNESPAEKLRRIAKLEADDEEWFRYYFPNYYKSEPAKFHIERTKRIMNNMEWFEVSSWARELSKSVRTMMEDLKLAMTKKKRNFIEVSNTSDNAERLLAPYKANLESNQRLINDYGMQIGYPWESGEFVTRQGVAFRALGAGQSPRGTRKDEIRPDKINIDDIDTDEICRNPDRVKALVNWVFEALIPTRSISEPLSIVVNGNIIARYSCVTELAKKARKHDIVNIRDKDGKSTWPNKNTEELIDAALANLPESAIQKEYYNNPMDDGDIFKEITFDHLPQLRHCDQVLIYADPAPSNKDRGSNSSKAVVILSRKANKYHVHKAWVNQMSNYTFVGILFDAYDICVRAGVDPVYIYIENNTLQDPFYQQVLKPAIFNLEHERNTFLPIREDSRKKPDKHVRIEGTLEPLNRMGHLVFNIREKDNPHMQRLETQFKAFTMRAKMIDGPDAVEGGVKKLQDIAVSHASGAIEAIKRTPSKHRM